MVLGAVLPVSPVGSGVLDRAWCAALVGVVAYLASTAKRGPLLVAAILAVAMARTTGGVTLGALAVLAGAISTRRLHRRATFVRGLSGAGAMAAALLDTRDHHPLVSALLVAAVALAIVWSGYPRASRRARSVLVRVVVLGFIAAVVASGMAALGAIRSAEAVDRAGDQLDLGLAAARQADADAANGYLAQAAAAFDQAHHRMDRWGVFGRLVPGVAQHVSALSGVLGKSGDAASQAARTALAVDVDSLQFQRGRIDPAAIGVFASPFRRLAVSLGEVVGEIEDHDSSLLLPPLHRRLRRLERSTTRAHRDALLAAEAAQAMPGLLGGNGPKHYLVLFTSPAEARGRFGFPGSFAEVSFDDGQYDLGEHGSTSALLDSLTPPERPTGDISDQLRPYLGYASATEVRSTTIIPDFPTVANVVARIWDASGRVPLDGVARFDPTALAQLVAFTGPVKVPTVGQPLNTNNLERYINIDQYLQFHDAATPRREALDTVADVTFERLETADLPGPRRLADVFGPLVEAGHLQIETFDEAGRAYFDRAGLDGRFEPGPSDSLLVANVNSTGNKIDSLLERSVTYDAVVSSGGELDGRVGVTLRNTAPSTGLPNYVIGSSTNPPLPTGTNRTTLLVYTSVPVVEATVDGRPVTVHSELTAGRWLHQLLLELSPGAQQKVVLHVRGTVPRDGGRYSLRLDRGDGVRPDAVSVDVRVSGGRGARFRGDLLSPVTLR